MIPFLDKSSRQKIKDSNPQREFMNKKTCKKSAILWNLFLTITLFTQHLCAKQKNKMVSLDAFSLSTPIIFDKKTLIEEAQKGTPPFLTLANHSYSKLELRELKKEFEKFTKHKDAKSMSLEELRQAADLALKLSWYDKALLYLKQMITASKDSETIKTVKLEIAEIYFQKGTLAKAEEAYKEYLELYPGADNAEYAHYKEVLCLFYQTLKTDQDQTPTRDTIKLTESYLEKGIAYKKYRNEINEIRKQCHLMLYQNEVNVFNFYMKKKSFGAASGRLAHLKQQYLQQVPGVEPDIIALECRLAQAQGNTERYQERLAFLNKKFPEYGKQTTRVAHKTRKNYATRF
jgi:outer membrane assembly lipoprotein YfiO